MKNTSIAIAFTLLSMLSILGCQKTTNSSQSALGSVSAASCIIGKWNEASLPLTLKMSNDFLADYDDTDLVADAAGDLNPLEVMAKAWNTGSTRTLLTIPFPVASTSGYTSTSSFRDGEIGIYKSYTWFASVSSSALAITQFYGIVTSAPGLGQYIELTHADIIANYRDYGNRFTMRVNPSLGLFDLPTVMLHEIGHLLGLCHESTKPSIMAPYYLTTQRSLKTYDADLIKDIYVDGTISAFNTKNSNTNALSSPIGTEVRGVIELHEDGKCIHYLEGKKIFEHQTGTGVISK